MQTNSAGSHLSCTTVSTGSKRLWTVSAEPGGVAQSVGHLTCKSGVLGSIPSLATYVRFSFHFFKKGSCQLLVKYWLIA